MSGSSVWGTWRWAKRSKLRRRVAPDGSVAPERAAEGHDLADEVRPLVPEAPGEHPPEAPAHDADRSARRARQALEEGVHAVEDLGGGARRSSEGPAVGVEAAGPEEGAHRYGRVVVGQEPGQDEDGVTVAVRRASEQGRTGQEVANSRDARVGSV